MKQIPDKYIDTLYAIYQVVKDDWDNQWKTEKDYIDWCRKVIIEYKLIIKDNGNLFLFTGRQYCS